MKRLKLLLPLLAILVALLGQNAYAHGFGERYDLPVPLSYFAVGAAAAVIFSFVLIGSLVKAESQRFDYPRLNLLRYSWFRAITSGPVLFPLKLLSVFLLFLVIVAGLFGSSRPVDNFAPTFIWVIWWVGLGFFVALLGNLWALINPWKIIYGWAEDLYQIFRPEQEMGMGFEYPKNWGIWPAVILFLAFSWAENAFVESGDPLRLGQMAISYSIITLGGMFAFGKRQWLKHGEAFSVVFGLLSRFSVTEVRVTDSRICDECSFPCRNDDGSCIDCYECFEFAEAEQREFNLRPPAMGLNNSGIATNDVMALVLLLLATVTFDGFSATPEWLEVQSFFITEFPELTSEFLNGRTIADTLGLILFPLVFALIFGLFSYVMRQAVKCRETAVTLAQAFVFSLIPIALAYQFAHFTNFLLIQGQQLIPLISDPLGKGWNLFGTVNYLVDVSIINSEIIWFYSVAVIVIGHIISALLAHLRAIRLFGQRELVMRSQLPMLALMVVYTMVSLWIISRPIVA